MATPAQVMVHVNSGHGSAARKQHAQAQQSDPTLVNVRPASSHSSAAASAVAASSSPVPPVACSPLPSSPLVHAAQLAWTRELTGPFNVLLASLHARAPTPNTTWKLDEITAAHSAQLQQRDDAVSSAASPASSSPSSSSASLAQDRPAYRSELLQAADRIFALFRHFHAQRCSMTSASAVTGAAAAADGGPASLRRLLEHAVFVRCTCEALTLVAQELLHIYASQWQRLWHGSGRVLLPHLFLHSDVVLLVAALRETIQHISGCHSALQAHVLSLVPASSSERLRAAILAASPQDAFIPLSALASSLGALGARMLDATRHAATQWCEESWSELFGFGAVSASKAKALAQQEGSDAWLVRKEMPQPFPVLPDLDRATEVPDTAAPSPNASPSPAPAPSPLSASAAAARAFADRPTPLLPVLEEYLLPLFAPAASLCEAASSVRVLATVLAAVLDSFLAFVLARGLKINGQGAARLNAEGRWLWEWMHLRHVRARGGSFAPPVAAVSSNSTFPRAASLYLSSADLHDMLPPPLLAHWRRALTVQQHGCWARFSAVASVLLDPRAYRAPSSKPPGAAKRLQIGVEPLLTWCWGRGGGRDSDGERTPPRPSLDSGPSLPARSSSPAPHAFANRVAPAELLSPPLSSPVPSPPAGSLSASPSSSPAPSPSSATSAGAGLYTSHGAARTPVADARGHALPDLERWLTLVSSAHQREFTAAAATHSATVNDWPERV